MACSVCSQAVLYMAWLLVLTPAWGMAVGHASQPRLGRRALLAAGAEEGTSSACSIQSTKMLTNGFFKVDPAGLPSWNNFLLMMTMAADAYPWSRQYGFQLTDVVDGLSHQQTAKFQRIFREKYTRLGASSIQFIDYYSQDLRNAGHAIVLGVPDQVFVIFRGTADIGQFFSSGNFNKMPWRIFGTDMQLYYAGQTSVRGLWPGLQKAVRAAVAQTRNPASTKLYIGGHSLGGASSGLAALLLKEQGYNIGAVYAFSPYKMGTTCKAEESCWSTVYERHLGAITYTFWNNQDFVPQLPSALYNAYLKTAPVPGEWVHVPRNASHFIRIVGDKCVPAIGKHSDLVNDCPPLVDAADGKQDGICQNQLGDHLPWNIYRRVAHCALLATPAAGAGNLRVDSCGRNAVWSALLGLQPPPTSGR